MLEQGGRASYTLLFNTTATHGLPAAINQASSALLRTATGNPAASIAARNHPLPTLQQEAAVKFSKVAGLYPSPLTASESDASLHSHSQPAILHASHTVEPCKGSANHSNRGSILGRTAQASHDNPEQRLQTLG